MRTTLVILFLIPFTVKAQDCIERIVIQNVFSQGISPVSIRYSAPLFLWEDLSSKEIYCFIRKGNTFTPVTQHPNARGNKIKLRSALKVDHRKVVATLIIKRSEKEESEKKQKKRCKRNQIVMREVPVFYYFFNAS